MMIEGLSLDFWDLMLPDLCFCLDAEMVSVFGFAFWAEETVFLSKEEFCMCEVFLSSNLMDV